MTLADALSGLRGPVVTRVRYERVTPAGAVLADVTPAFVSGSIEANEDRAVYRTARFVIDPARPEAAELDPLTDIVRVTVDVRDGGAWVPCPVGSFCLTMPRFTVREDGVRQWEVEAFDLTRLLLDSTTTAAYAVPAGANCVAAAAAVLAGLGLPAQLEPSSAVLAAPRQWPAGTPWLDVVNGLLQAANCYALWFDRFGVARSMPARDLATVQPAVTYGPAQMLTGTAAVESELTRLANRVVAVVRDPALPAWSAVAENTDPNSALGIPRLGKVFTKVLEVESAASQAALQGIAERYLREQAGIYRRMTFTTLLDPRRDAHEVYEVEAPAPAGGRWWTRGHRFSLEPGAVMEHTVARVIIGGLA
jgi:hypothetical protein